MKKNTIYIILAAVAGFFVSYLIFGRDSTEKIADTHEHSNIEIADWTCSMHPQIMQPDPGACPICGMDLIPAATSVEGLAPDQFKMSENALALANVQTTIVGAQFAEGNAIRLSGKIEINEEANAVQTAHFSGRIEKLYLNYTGETVRRGQLLALVYSPELVAAQQELLTALSLKKSQPDLYQAVRNKLSLWKLSNKQLDAIETTGKIKNNFAVYANVSGVVSEKMVSEGDHVKEGSPLFKIVNLSSVWASFDAYENMISSLKKGQSITIKAKAYPNENFEAVISFIDPVLNSSTRTVTVRAVLKNKNEKFKPGMFVEGIVNVGSSSTSETISLPKSAVLWTGQRSVVYVKPEADYPVFQMREVVLGEASGEYYVIAEGISAGEEVVTNGAFTVDASAQLQGKKSMMNQEKKAVSESNQINDQITFSRYFETNFYPILDRYERLKNALVVAEVKQVSKEATSMIAALERLKASDVEKRERAVLDRLQKNVMVISETLDIQTQQIFFKTLSDDLITVVSGFKNFKNILYVQHCPMAGNNKGAQWLSYENAIKNPYFGGQMLTCGSVIDTLQNK